MTAAEDPDDFDVVGQITLLIRADGSLGRMPGTIGAAEPIGADWTSRPKRGRGYPIVCGPLGEPYRHPRFAFAPLAITAVAGGVEVSEVVLSEKAYLVRHVRVLGLVNADPDPRPRPLLHRASGLYLLVAAVITLSVTMITALSQMADGINLGSVIASAIASASVLGGAYWLNGLPQGWAGFRRRRWGQVAARQRQVPFYDSLEEAMSDWGFDPPSLSGAQPQ